MSFTAPLGPALYWGWKQGGWGLVLGLIAGLILSAGNFYGLWLATGKTFARIDKLASERAQNAAIALFYGAITLWIFVACAISDALMRALIRWLF